MIQFQSKTNRYLGAILRSRQHHLTMDDIDIGEIRVFVLYIINSSFITTIIIGSVGVLLTAGGEPLGRRRFPS